jgi:hypothetical protein
MKATKAVIRQRVEQVMKIRLLGGEFHDIRQYAAENEPETGRPWKLSDRQLWRYVQASDLLLEKYLEHDRGKLFNRHIGQRRALFARAVEAADWRTALAVAKDEADLYGLYAPHKIAPTNPDGTEPYSTGIDSLFFELRSAVERHRRGAGEPPSASDPGTAAG